MTLKVNVALVNSPEVVLIYTKLNYRHNTANKQRAVSLITYLYVLTLLHFKNGLNAH